MEGRILITAQGDEVKGPVLDALLNYIDDRIALAIQRHEVEEVD